MWDHLPNRREHSDGIKYSPKICERCEDEIRNNGYRVKTICEDPIEESDEGEQKWSQECNENRESDMRECEMCEKECHTKHNCSSYHTADNSSGDESEYDNPIWSRGYEYLFDRLLEFCHIEWRHHMWEGIHDDRHHDESRHDELHICESPNRLYLRSDELTEYHIIECRCDHRWYDRLPPDSEEALDFFSDNGHIWDKECWGIHMKIFFNK